MRRCPSGTWLAILAGFSLCCSDLPHGTMDRPRRQLSEGYVLFSPLLSTKTFLLDRSGKPVHTWESDFGPGASVYLLDNGHLVRPGRHPNAPVFHDGGMGGRLQEFTWEGELVWDWVIASEERLQHHDVMPLPNGNLLLIAWEVRTRDQALRAGRRPDRVGPAGLWPDCVLEVRPEPPRGGSIVWEWHLWDHLIQEFDPARDNYGRVSEHPELVDINGGRGAASITDDLLQRLRSLGYLSQDGTAADFDADFVHTDAIAYNPRLDQIVLTSNQFNEIWIIDHSTTIREAAGHDGGRAGRGGDLLYRWGNPGAYGRGGAGSYRLYGPHDGRWIPDGYPGAGHLMIFNNGLGRPGNPWSAVIEIAPPLMPSGLYRIDAGSPFGPGAPLWEHTAPTRSSFYADFISGAHRLADGNTFITAGPQGRFFEVTAGRETVWELVNPFSGNAPNPAGDPPFSVFRATFIPATHPALVGRNLQSMPAPGSHPATRSY